MSRTKKFAMHLHIGEMTISFSKCENATGKKSIKKLIEKKRISNEQKLVLALSKAEEEEETKKKFKAKKPYCVLRKRNSTQNSFFPT